jgi:hypothetical protein
VDPDEAPAPGTPRAVDGVLEHDYVWVERVGVLWNPPDGDLRRARFTHGTHFQTQRGEFYIDSEGSARELSDRDGAKPAKAA